MNIKKYFCFFLISVFSVSSLYSQTRKIKKAGDKTAFTANGISFNMIYVPGNLTFPTGKNDEGIAKVDKAYWIGEKLVSYELWYKVKTWAEKNGYIFANEGSKPSDYDNVTEISWRDAMVFSNALTEWYNAANRKKYTCAYYVDKNFTTPIRGVNNSGTISAEGGASNGTEDGPYIKTNATGFRLLSNNEWELAIRYRGNSNNNTCGEKACLKIGEYFWMPGYFHIHTDIENIKELHPNPLGIYDIGWPEWCFDAYSSSRTPSSGLRVIRGFVGEGFTDYIRLGLVVCKKPYQTEQAFRMSRTDL
ncbi:MAG: SUMF1/EgtB/PvdO family nonheme iron enzyme [Proteobacteria bacterium]|nr:SUMF1/EgtB/PvdO family nonheme iron enzyme [Pseudomonadota bacterium]